MDAGVRVDGELVGDRETGFALLRMNGVDRADFQAGKTFRSAARFADYVGQLLLPQTVAAPRPFSRTEDKRRGGSFLQVVCKFENIRLCN